MSKCILCSLMMAKYTKYFRVHDKLFMIKLNYLKGIFKSFKEFKENIWQNILAGSSHRKIHFNFLNLRVVLLHTKFLLVCLKVIHYWIVKQNELFAKIEFAFAFPAQRKVQCNTWFHEKCFIAQTQWNYWARYAKSLLTWTSILKRARNFGEHGKMENTQASGTCRVAWLRRKLSILIFVDTQAGFYEKQTKIYSFYKAHFKIYFETDFTCSKKTLKLEKIQDSYYTARDELANWCLQCIQANGSFMILVIGSKKCLFHIDGKVN